jgi:hypothetical protein
MLIRCVEAKQREIKKHDSCSKAVKQMPRNPEKKKTTCAFAKKREEEPPTLTIAGFYL